ERRANADSQCHRYTHVVRGGTDHSTDSRSHGNRHSHVVTFAFHANLQSCSSLPHARRASGPPPHECCHLRRLPVLRTRSLVANLPYLPQQIRKRHTGQRFKQRRYLRRHLGDVAGDLVHPGSFTVPSRDNGDLVHVRQRTGQRLHHLRHVGEQF